MTFYYEIRHEAQQYFEIIIIVVFSIEKQQTIEEPLIIDASSA